MSCAVTMEICLKMHCKFLPHRSVHVLRTMNRASIKHTLLFFIELTQSYNTQHKSTAFFIKPVNML